MSAPREARLDALTADFVTAAGQLRAQRPTWAMVTLPPLHLSEDELAPRVHLMTAAGVLATARLAPADVRDLLTADHAEPVDLLVALVALYARLGRGTTIRADRER